MVMNPVLSSWKEIAQFLGKGVRTAQRWERELGLPVHRPEQSNRYVVLADPDELRHWMKARGSQHGPPHAAESRAADPITRTQALGEQLSRQMNSVQKQAASLRTNIRALREYAETAVADSKNGTHS
jgi:hypothetical protein